jgi:NTE family protein
VLASSAIPIVFPPVRVDGDTGGLWFGDGALRLTAPMSPAIRLGASRILAIGIRSSRAADTLAHEERGPTASESDTGCLPCPPLAQVCGVFFNAIFLDHLDADVDHLRRMNTLIARHSHNGSAHNGSPHNGPAHAGDSSSGDETVVEGMRPIEPLVVSPSEDLALVAQRFAHRMPRLVRYVLDGLGIPDAQSADLMSYLLFDSAYTRTLVEIGWRDADARAAEIEDFIRSAEPMAEPVVRAPRRLHAVAGTADAAGTGA